MHPKATTRRLPALAAALALALTAACAPGAERAETDSLPASAGDDDQQAGDQVAEQPADVPAEPQTAEATAPAAAAEPPGEPLATVEGTSPFTELEIADLRRVGDSVTLEFVIVTDDTEGHNATDDRFAAPADQFGAEGVGIASSRRSAVSGVTLVDQVNRKRHLVLRDTDGLCLCTAFQRSSSAEPNTRYRHSAQFPAPPADVTEMTVQVPLFPAVDNVPLRSAG